MDRGDHYGTNVFEIIRTNFQTVCSPGPNRLFEPSSGQRFQPYLYHLNLWMHYTGHIDDVSSRS